MNFEYLLIVLGVILVSMTLHEVMHGFMAYWLGDDTAKHEGRLTLNPVVHIDPFMTILLPLLLAVLGGPIFGGAKPVPFNPARLKYDEWGVALVALAGPLTNLFIAFLSFGLLVITGSSSVGLSGSNDLFTTVLILALQVNLGFFAFNLIPLPPLDGSRVLYALAPEFVRRGMERIEQFGIFVVFILVVAANSFIFQYMQTVVRFFIDLFARLFGVA